MVEGFFFSLSMEKNQQLKKEIGLLDASMIVIGSMIGSGIFIVSADVTRNLGSPIDRASEIVLSFCTQGPNQTMNKYNQ